MPGFSGHLSGDSLTGKRSNATPSRHMKDTSSTLVLWNFTSLQITYLITTPVMMTCFSGLNGRYFCCQRKFHLDQTRKRAKKEGIRQDLQVSQRVFRITSRINSQPPASPPSKIAPPGYFQQFHDHKELEGTHQNLLPHR